MLGWRTGCSGSNRISTPGRHCWSTHQLNDSSRIDNRPNGVAITQSNTEANSAPDATTDAEADATTDAEAHGKAHWRLWEPMGL